MELTAAEESSLSAMVFKKNQLQLQKLYTKLYTDKLQDIEKGAEFEKKGVAALIM
jgi:hypothetical protein